eukprot:403369123
MEDPFGDYDLFFKPFLCPQCRCSYSADENPPTITQCCNRTVCRSCIPIGIDGLNAQQCPSCHSQIGTQTQNFTLKDSLSSLIENQNPPKTSIYKKFLKIGFLHPDLTVEYFKFIYFEGMQFQNKIKQFQVEEDENSLLGEKMLKVEFEHSFQFTQAYFSLKNLTLCFENQMYVIKCPRDGGLSARPEFRQTLRKYFDLVLIQNGYPLEPNYVFIDSVPSHFIELDVKRLNLEKFPNVNPKDVKVRKLEIKSIQGTSAQLATMLFDFKDNSEAADNFAIHLKRNGVIIDSLGQPNSVMNVEQQEKTYYRNYFTAIRSLNFRPPAIGQVQQSQAFQSRQPNVNTNSNRIGNTDWQQAQSRPVQSQYNQPAQQQSNNNRVQDNNNYNQDEEIKQKHDEKEEPFQIKVDKGAEDSFFVNNQIEVQTNANGFSGRGRGSHGRGQDRSQNNNSDQGYQYDDYNGSGPMKYESRGGRGNNRGSRGRGSNRQSQESNPERRNYGGRGDGYQSYGQRDSQPRDFRDNQNQEETPKVNNQDDLFTVEEEDNSSTNPPNSNNGSSRPKQFGRGQRGGRGGQGSSQQHDDNYSQNSDNRGARNFGGRGDYNRGGRGQNRGGYNHYNNRDNNDGYQNKDFQDRFSGNNNRGGQNRNSQPRDDNTWGSQGDQQNEQEDRAKHRDNNYNVFDELVDKKNSPVDNDKEQQFKQEQRDQYDAFENEGGSRGRSRGDRGSTGQVRGDNGRARSFGRGARR